MVMLWIDGDHSYKGVKRDWLAWRTHLKRDAVVGFDDSTDERLGPKRLLAELVASGELADFKLVESSCQRGCVYTFNLSFEFNLGGSAYVC